MSGVSRIVIKKDIFNDIYLPEYKNQCRFLNLVGGAGSGKSVFAAQKLIIRLMKEHSHRFILIRKVHRTIRNSQYQLIKDLIGSYGLTSLFRFKDGDLSIECPHTNGTIISSGIDNPEKLKSIAGITGSWIEEATELTSQDFTQLNLRLRGNLPNYKQHILTYNPINEFHWINNRFFVKKDPRASVLKTTFLDNRFIDEDYKGELLKLKTEDETLWKIYGLGEWATASGLVYKNWTETNSMPDQLDDEIYGLDFGFTAPTSLLRIGKVGGEIYVEELIYRAGMTNTELIAEMQHISKEHGLNIQRMPVYADNEDANRIKELTDAGFYIKAVDKTVVAGLEYCRRFNLHVTDKSANVMKELRSYKYKQDIRTGLYFETPVKFQDHAMDALRMAMYSHGQKYWREKRQFTTSSRASRKKERIDITSGYN